MNVQPLFNLMVEKRASDLFLTCFAPVKIKIDGKIIPVNKLELTPAKPEEAEDEPSFSEIALDVRFEESRRTGFAALR